MAEVLITLGVIGVVAAVTMPTLIQKHQKQVYVTGLKRGISVVDNMFKKMQADEEVSSFSETTLATDGICYDGSETCSDWYGNLSVFENIIPKYIKTVRMCKRSECDAAYSYPSTSFDYSNLNQASVFDIIGSHSTSSNRQGDGFIGIYSQDGMIYYIAPGGYNWGVLVGIDVNGRKGPNQLGRDLFTFKYHEGKVFLYEYSADIYAKRIMSNGWKMDY